MHPTRMEDRKTGRQMGISIFFMIISILPPKRQHK